MDKKSMDKKSIEARIDQIANILLGARKKVIDTFIEKGYASDPFIENLAKKEKKNLDTQKLLLPHIYSFEIIMAPIGYITGNKELKKKPPILNNFLMENFIKDEKNKDECKKIFDTIWELKLDKIINYLNYDKDAFPYGESLNYEAMSWIYGAAIDGMDFLKSIKDPREDYIMSAVVNFMKKFFEPLDTSPIKLDDGKEKKTSKLSGFYFSQDKFDFLNRFIDNLSSYISQAQFDMFMDNVHSRLAFATSNQSVLAVYDITKDVVDDRERLTGPYNEAFEKLFVFAKNLIKNIPKSFSGKDIDPQELYYHICNYGILTSLSNYEGLKGELKKSEEYWTKIIDYFFSNFNKQKEYRLPVNLYVPIEIPPQDISKDEKPDYVLNVPMPILIRSMANMLNNARKLGIDPNAFEDKLVQGIDLFIKEYKDKDGDFFDLPDDDGKWDYDLSLTNMAVECLTLSLGYFLNRWQEFEEEKPKEGGAWISNEDFQKFEHWKNFKEALINEFDSRIEHVLTNHIDEILEKKLPSLNITSQNVNTRFRALDEFFTVLEKTNEFLEPKDKQLKELWVFILECTKLMDEIKPTDMNLGSHTDKLKEQIEKVRKIRENVISHYFFLNQDQNFENILSENQAELNKVKEALNNKGKK